MERASTLESAFGLWPGSLSSGFKIREISDVQIRSPRSPVEGNRFFLGAGNHLLGGAPEMVVDSISSIDGLGVRTISTVGVVP